VEFDLNSSCAKTIADDFLVCARAAFLGCCFERAKFEVAPFQRLLWVVFEFVLFVVERVNFRDREALIEVDSGLKFGCF
jgi:hypothetical protein